MKSIYLLAILLVFTACSAPEKQQETVEAPYTLATPKAEWVTERVSDAKTRLSATEAGQLVWNAMEFHGGLEQWWKNGPVYFRFNYQPRDGGTPRDTYETADFWSSKTRHQRVSDANQEYGWDGENAWHSPADAVIPYNTRFWALTPYYFAGMPFVFADEGVNLEQKEDVDYEGAKHHIVKVTYGENIGDAPDDYYVLYIHSETFRLSAIRYIVSYPGYFKKGQHTQEKLMTYEGQQKVNGITFPQKHRTFMWEADGTVGKYVTDITLSDVAFKPETEQSYFVKPAGAAVMEGLVK